MVGFINYPERFVNSMIKNQQVNIIMLSVTSEFVGNTQHNNAPRWDASYYYCGWEPYIAKPKIPRNSPYPCNSGLKFKYCCQLKELI